MNLLFHSNGACFRGTSQSLMLYAKYCRDIWKHNVYLTYGRNDQWNRPEAVKWWADEFGDNVVTYSDFSEVNQIIKDKQIDFCYQVKGGERDGKIPTGCKLGVHAVFRNNEPHGDVYAYISKWLSDVMSNGTLPYIEYPVVKIEPNGTLHSELDIPDHAIILGRHGGNDQFDVDFVHQLTYQIACNNPNIYFIFMNTNKFCPDLPNIKHIPATADHQRIANFIKTCDAGWMARMMGESFGVAICNYLALDKPCFAYRGNCGDRNHLDIIDDEYYLYDNPQDLINKLNRFLSNHIVEQPGYFSQKVEKYSLANIMETQFKPVFLGT